MAAEIDAVLFDFAGTLFVPRDPRESVREVATRLGAGLGEEEVGALAAAYAAAGLPGGAYPASVPEHLAGLYAERDLRPDAHRAAYVALLETVEAPCAGFGEALYGEVTAPGHWVPYADAADVVGALVDRGVAVGVISNVGFDLRPILRAHAFDVLAERCTLSYEHRVAKPDPRLFEAALQSLGADAARTLMVGDHPADGGAAAVGCRTLLIPMSPPGTTHGLDQVLALVPSPADGPQPRQREGRQQGLRQPGDPG